MKKKTKNRTVDPAVAAALDWIASTEARAQVEAGGVAVSAAFVENWQLAAFLSGVRWAQACERAKRLDAPRKKALQPPRACS